MKIEIIKRTGTKFTIEIDEEDYDRVMLHNWRLLRQLKRNSTSYAITTINGKICSLHRYVMGLTTGDEKGKEIDHLDRNGLNCKKENMRICDRGTNHQNRKAWGKSKYKGVTYDKNSFIAHLKYKNKGIHIGTFDTEEEAAYAYNVKVSELYNEEYLKLNDVRLSEEVMEKIKNRVKDNIG